MAGTYAAASAAVSAAGRRVCFLTDAEGSWSYVRHFVRQSSCLFLERSGDEGSGSGGWHDDETLQLRDDCVLVFGGDAGDKGDETLRCYEQLVRLKKRHPERVVLLVGNRDVNKMRLTSELADSELGLHAMAPEVRDGPLWVPPDKRVTITDFLARQVSGDPAATASVQTDTAAANAGEDRDAALLRAVNTKVNRLKWMLEYTMGAQGDFERRRAELASRTAPRSSSGSSGGGGDTANVTSTPTTASDTVDDESVLRSYMESVQEGGVVREYLELGCLAFIAHGTLFTHGGIIQGPNGECVLGRVPGRPSTMSTSGASSVSSMSSATSTAVASLLSLSSHPADSSSWRSPLMPSPSQQPQCSSEVAEWVQELNGWYQQQVQEWIEQPTWSADRSHRGGNELLKYVLPNYPASVVMGRHLHPSGMPVQLPSDAAQALSASGIQRLVVGHTPHGTCPTVIKQKRDVMPTEQQLPQHQQSTAAPRRGFEEVIMCDTSYSDTTASDNRGAAAVELVVEADGRAHVHGVLPDGRTIAYASDDPLIGRELRDGTQVKAKLQGSRTDDSDSVERSSSSATASGGSDSDEYLVYSVENGFSYTYHYRTRAELVKIGFAD